MELTLEKINSVFELYKTIIKKEVEKKLPYHINVIDLLWANENAHSRILAHLLKQNDNGKFEILENFCRYLSRKNENFNLKISNPIITFEKDRIDILVQQDKDFALIIENKIHNASDQSEQLKRYIDKVKEKCKCEEEKIYLLYLPRDEYKIVNDQSWGKYKDGFAKRFINLSFKDILYWLKEDVLPNIKIKDIYLKSALEQYTDHLEGLFNLRENQNIMKKEIQEIIYKELGLDDDTKQNFEKLNDFIQKIDDIKKELDLHKKENFWNNIENRIKENFPKLEFNRYNNKISIPIKWNDNTDVEITIAIEKHKPFIGVSKNPENENDKDFFHSLQKKENNIDSNPYWHYWSYVDEDKADEKFIELIKFVNDYLLKK